MRFFNYYSSATVVLYPLLACITAARGNATSSENCTYNYVLEEADQAYRHPNVSAKYKLPSFSPPGVNTSIPAGDWTWNIDLFANVTASDITRWFSIDTPTLKNVDDKDIPYVGCAIRLSDLSRNISLRGQDDNGDCSVALGRDCANALVSFVNGRAKGLTGTTEDPCRIFEEFATSFPPECGPYFENGPSGNGGSMSTLDNLPSSLALFTSDTTNETTDNLDMGSCPVPYMADNSVQGLFGVSGLFPDSGDDYAFNETLYDEITYVVTPFLTTAWLKEIKGYIASNVWTDTRLICMRAKDVQDGSRIPEPVQQPPPAGTSGTSAATPSPTGLAAKGRELSIAGVIGTGFIAIMLIMAL
ncbi:MAG: hypothetical protein Q9214_002002 [Letrouitia sp. 1 TL-2023]